MDRRQPTNRPNQYCQIQEKKPYYTEQSKIQKYHHPKKATPTHQFKFDRYTASRGAPKMLNIHCDDCGDLLITYQKDGPGRLLRCYLDRIHAPREFEERQYDNFDVKTSPNLSCRNRDCRLIIGTPMIYKSESRPAYNLVKGSFYIKASQ